MQEGTSMTHPLPETDAAPETAEPPALTSRTCEHFDGGFCGKAGPCYWPSCEPRPLASTPPPEQASTPPAYSAPFTTDVPQCCGDPETCNEPCFDAVINAIASEDRIRAEAALDAMVEDAQRLGLYEQASTPRAEPVRMWIDTEFNEHEGRHELISMALVCEDGREWYQVLPCLAPRPWVAANVMPKLGKEPISLALFAASLQEFLRPYPAIHVIGDWPSDIALFCDVLIVGPGQRIDTPVLTMEIIRLDGESMDPHNALADARGIRDAHLYALPPSTAPEASTPGQETDAVVALRELMDAARTYQAAILEATGLPYPWPALEIAWEQARRALESRPLLLTDPTNAEVIERMQGAQANEAGRRQDAINAKIKAGR